MWFLAERGGHGACLVHDPDGKTGLHTRNDDYMWGGGTTSVDQEYIEEVRKYTSESFLEQFFDLDA